jgi:hypothetical protein
MLNQFQPLLALFENQKAAVGEPRAVGLGSAGRLAENLLGSGVAQPLRLR